MSLRIEILAIGDELLDGRVTDTNTVRLANALFPVGARLSQRTTITDDIDAILREARAIIARGTDICVVSGGLGPTSDDLTSEAFAQLAGVDLVRDAKVAEAITERLQKRGRVLTPNQLKQADRPRGAKLIPNPVGTAPGFDITIEGCRFMSFPGVPKEFDVMVAQSLIAPLQAHGEAIERRGLYCYGAAEGDMGQRISSTILEKWPEVRLGFRVKFPEVHVTLWAPRAHVSQLNAALHFAKEALRDCVYAEEEISLAEALLRLLQARGQTLALAESCTGGLVGDLLTDIPGASETFLCGVVAYSYAAKQNLLGVPAEILLQHGAVSEATVLAMANGARAAAGADFALAISGIAGPGGETAEKPVGTIWLAGVGPNWQKTHMLSVPFDRRWNKIIAAHSALDMLRRHVL